MNNRNSIYFSVWMAIINSVLKRPRLNDFSSFNFYYNYKTSLFCKNMYNVELDKIYSILDIHKISMDFKLKMVEHNKKSKSTYIT